MRCREFDTGLRSVSPNCRNRVSQAKVLTPGWAIIRAAVNGDIDSNLFGQVVNVAPPRLIQSGLKLHSESCSIRNPRAHARDIVCRVVSERPKIILESDQREICRTARTGGFSVEN